jgi:serine/threonine protein kinase
VSAGRPSWDFAEGDEIVAGRTALKLLGGGLRAEAWLAWDESRGEPVVVKVLRPNHAGSAHARKSMAREVRALQTLSHPQIVRFFDYSIEGSRPFIVMEALDGPRLSAVIRRSGPLAPEQVVGVGGDMAAALAHVHDAGMVHMDVKPKNIVLSAEPKLIDLGMVRTLSEVRALTAVIGTTAYMSPEQCRVETIPTFGPPGDVWGLGVTLYQAATGRTPFPKSTEADEYPQTHRLPEPLTTEVPKALGRSLMATLAYDPDDRPTARELAAELEPTSAP